MTLIKAVETKRFDVLLYSNLLMFEVVTIVDGSETYHRQFTDYNEASFVFDLKLKALEGN